MLWIETVYLDRLDRPHPDGTVKTDQPEIVHAQLRLDGCETIP